MSETDSSASTSPALRLQIRTSTPGLVMRIFVVAKDLFLVCVCERHVYGYFQMPGNDVLEVGVTGICEPPNMHAGNQTLVLRRNSKCS